MQGCADVECFDSDLASSGDLPQPQAPPRIPDLFAIRDIPTQLAQEIVQQFHYRQSKAPCTVAFGLFHRVGVHELLPFEPITRGLVGVVAYGVGASTTLRKGVCGPDEAGNVYELTRLWLMDGLPRNCESFLIGHTLRRLDKEIIVAYADTGQGHVGFVYQATNWLYTGLSTRFSDPVNALFPNQHHTGWAQKLKHEIFNSYDADAKIIPGSHLAACRKHDAWALTFVPRQDQFSLARAVAEEWGGHVTYAERTSKHRYVFFNCGARRRAQLRSKLRYTVLPYPKTAAGEEGCGSMTKWMVEQRAADGTWHPIALRGSTPTAEDERTVLRHLSQRVGDESPTTTLGVWRIRHPQTGQIITASTFYLSKVRRLADRYQDSGVSDYFLRSLPATATPINGNGATATITARSFYDFWRAVRYVAECQRGGVNLTDLNSVGVILADVKSQAVEWLWANRIPRAKLTLLEGDPDEGKSTVAFDLAARVSTGAAMPLDTTMTKPAGVVILSAEDALGDTIRPRLEAAGADLDRILGFRFEELPTIPEGLTVIEQAIKRVEAALIIIDPLVAFFSRAVHAYRDHDVRRALTPLMALAERTGAAVLAVRHLNKARMARAKYRGSGSIGILGAARSALLVARDPDDANRRLLAPVKQNLAVPAPAVAFTLVSAGTTARIAWLGETSHTAETLLAQPPPEADRAALTDAVEFLQAALADGERPATDVLTEATALGIAERTLRRARKALGVLVRRQGFKDGRFLLALPANDADPARGTGKPNGFSNGNGNGNGNGLDHDPPIAANGFSVS